MPIRSTACACPILLLCATALAQVPTTGPEWISAEAPVLTGHTLLTDPDRFLKAGEAYFSHDATRIIFQAVEHPAEGQTPDPHYAMYVADLAWSDTPTIHNITRVSRPGASTTCGWFHPDDANTILFGSTMAPPSGEDTPGYQRGTSRYAWAFPPEMEIVATSLPDDLSSGTVTPAEPLWTRDGYDAEGSWSPDGRHILYTRLNPDLPENEGDLWMRDMRTGGEVELVAEPGYDGGPFFSADGRSIIYRSDRRRDKHLQIFAAPLAFDETGSVTGIEREVQLTDNEFVNWCPFLDPTGDFALYATSEIGHGNYEVFAVEASLETDKPASERVRIRVTHAPGFDGLPVFSPDGDWVMWTSQRPPISGDPSTHVPTSQLWVAKFDAGALRAGFFDAAMRRAAGLDD